MLGNKIVPKLVSVCLLSMYYIVENSKLIYNF